MRLVEFAAVAVVGVAAGWATTGGRRSALWPRLPALAATALVLTAAGFAVQPLHTMLRETKTFHAAHQTQVGPPGYPLLPPALVAAARRAVAGGGSWALITAPIDLPDNDPNAPGLLAAARRLQGMAPYTPDDARHMRASLLAASGQVCGNIGDLGWLAFEMMPYRLDCQRPTFLIYYQRPLPPGSNEVSSGPGWSVAREGG